MASITYVKSDSLRQKANKLERLIYLSENSHKQIEKLINQYNYANHIYSQPGHKDWMGNTITKAKLRVMKDNINRYKEARTKYYKQVQKYFKDLEAHGEYSLISQYRKKIGVKKTPSIYTTGIKLKRK